MNAQYTKNTGEFTSYDGEIWEEVRRNIHETGGMIEVYVGKPRRTSRQNRTIHALFKDVSEALNTLGVKLEFGFNTMNDATWTPITAKEIFFKIRYCSGMSTGEMLTDELAEAVDAMLKDFAEAGVYIQIKKPLRGRKTMPVKRVENLLTT